MEDSLSLNKSKSYPVNSKSSSKKQGNVEQNPISSKQKKKKNEDLNEKDLTDKILSNLSYENFESENEKFYSHFRKKHDEIYIENSSLLEQNRFRFLISNNSPIFKNYTTYEKGNFINITWEDIKLVYYYYVEDYQCPICLENKICCPIIIKCGHIFCYPCFLNFYNYYTITSINKKIPNCPLCSERIDLEKNQIKFCEMIQCRNYTNNMNIKFNLIMREKTSPTLFNLFYDPSLKKWKKSLKFQMRSIPLEISKEFLFSRIFTTNKKFTSRRINNLLNELKEELKEEKDFYADENRIKCLNQCIENLNNMLKENEQQKDFILESVFQNETKTNNNNNTSTFNKFDLNNNNNINNNMNNSNNMNNNVNNIVDSSNTNNINEDEEINYKKYFLFYQEQEGDIYYLHPFIMNILLSEYGDYSNLPVVISGNILDVEMKQVTPYIKSNYPYLSHLILGSIIFFVEIDVTKLISPSTRKKFNHDLNERAKYRRLLSNEEKNYEKFINKKSIKEQEELKNYYSYHNQLKILKDIEKKKEEEEKKQKEEKEGQKLSDNNNVNDNNNNDNINNNNVNDDNNNNNVVENNIEENKKEEEKEKEKDNSKEVKNPKKENMLKKLLEEDKKEKEEKEREEKERLERIERERREKEKKESKTFIFDENDFPELSKNNEKEKEKEKEKNNNINKGGKKGKKKGKKKFQEIGEDFLKDAFNDNPDEKEKEQEKANDKKTKGKKSSKNN